MKFQAATIFATLLAVAHAAPATTQHGASSQNDAPAPVQGHDPAHPVTFTPGKREQLGKSRISKNDVAFSPEKRSQINDCGNSSFEDQTSGASPFVSDCQQMAANIAGGGTWTVDGFGSPHQLIQFGTCRFDVSLQWGDLAYIGNEDIINLINSSIQKFQSGGKVGSKGSMGCQAAFGNGPYSVTWGLY